MKKLLLSAIAVAFAWLPAMAQEYMSNSDLLTVKERSEEMRTAWIKLFDVSAENGDFGKLSTMRTAMETYLDGEMVHIRKLFSEGDGRALLTAVSNYVQIEKQFARDIMKPAEAFTKASTDEVTALNQRISEFAQKERMFTMEVNNAILTSPEPAAPVDPEMNAEDGDADSPEDASESRHKKKPKAAPAAPGRKKLPHEIANEKKSKEESDEDE